MKPGATSRPKSSARCVIIGCAASATGDAHTCAKSSSNNANGRVLNMATRNRNERGKRVKVSEKLVHMRTHNRRKGSSAPEIAAAARLGLISQTRIRDPPTSESNVRPRRPVQVIARLDDPVCEAEAWATPGKHLKLARFSSRCKRLCTLPWKRAIARKTDPPMAQLYGGRLNCGRASFRRYERSRDFHLCCQARGIEYDWTRHSHKGS